MFLLFLIYSASSSLASIFLRSSFAAAPETTTDIKANLNISDYMKFDIFYLYIFSSGTFLINILNSFHFQDDDLDGLGEEYHREILA